MMNPAHHFARMRELLEEFAPSRERSLAATKLDECELWLARCQPTAEALGRDLASVPPAAWKCMACGESVSADGTGKLAVHGNPPCPASGVQIVGRNE